MVAPLHLVVSVGNTDDKLSQSQWSEFVMEMSRVLEPMGQIHFFGGPPTAAPWQNAGWIVELDPAIADGGLIETVAIFSVIKKVREKYNQDSAFVMLSPGTFV